jgi:hypothetical protein
MIVESIVVLTMYWPQTISVSVPTHTETKTSWKVTSNNAVNLNFSESVNNMELFGYGSISGETIMPNDQGTFRVSIDNDVSVVLTVTADEQFN